MGIQRRLIPGVDADEQSELKLLGVNLGNGLEMEVSRGRWFVGGHKMGQRYWEGSLA